MIDQLELFLSEEVSNPLDGVEDLLASQNWTFNRMNRDELLLEMKGTRGVYHMIFTWEESIGAMQFCCEFDLRLADQNYASACCTLNNMNNKLWLGHFDLDGESMTPCFRHTQLFRGLTQTSGADYLQDLIHVAIEQCDQNYAVFQMLSSVSVSPDSDSLSLALMPTLGSS
ncbi:MAG: YbjN domain-containing protein [Alphaproteobacteria bacterium]|nr:YbjN domain-containing protein [Alphaproteobacteria bacterium]